MGSTASGSPGSTGPLPTASTCSPVRARPGESLRFFVDCLGFNVALDHHFPDGWRWVAIAPPDGTARLALIAPKPGSQECEYIGKVKQVVFSDRGCRSEVP